MSTPTSRAETEKHWNEVAQVLVGKKVVSASYMGEMEARAHGWLKRPLVLTFDDGSMMYASADDEGNDGGALFGVAKDGSDRTFPVL